MTNIIPETIQIIYLSSGISLLQLLPYAKYANIANIADKAIQIVKEKVPLRTDKTTPVYIMQRSESVSHSMHSLFSST